MSDQNLSWLEQHAYDLRNAIAATDESITSDAQLLAKPAQMKQRIDDLEVALQLIGECTACPSCKHRALDALAGGASKRKQVTQIVAQTTETVSVPKDLLQRICGMVYATRGEQHRLNFVTDAEYGKLVSLRHGGRDSIATVLTALSGE